MGANVISSTTSFAPTRGAQNVKTLQGALAYSFSSSPTPTFSFREFFHRGSSASAPGHFLGRPFERTRVSNSVWRALTVFLMGIFCSPLGRERGATNDLVRAQEGRSTYHDSPEALIITPSAPASTLLFEVFVWNFPTPVGIFLLHKANPNGLTMVGSHTCIAQAIWRPERE